jgi:hypothetical protein
MLSKQNTIHTRLGNSGLRVGFVLTRLTRLHNWVKHEPDQIINRVKLVTRTRSNCEPGYATRTHEPVPTPQPQIPIRIAITGENNQSYQTTQSGHGFQTHITRETMFTANKCQILGSQVRKPKTRKDTALSV